MKNRLKKLWKRLNSLSCSRKKKKGVLIPLSKTKREAYSGQGTVLVNLESIELIALEEEGRRYFIVVRANGVNYYVPRTYSDYNEALEHIVKNFVPFFV